MYTAGTPKNEIADMLSRLVKEDRYGSTVDDCVIDINDSILSQVRHFIQNGWPVELEVYVRLNYELSVFNDVRLHTCRHPYHNSGHTMLNMVHEVHPGIVRTKHMHVSHLDTSKTTSTTESCAVIVKSTKPTHPPIQPISCPEKP